MTILGRYLKQPVEVEIYGIQFAEDMAATDQLTTAWTLIARENNDDWDLEVKAAPYTALLTDVDRIIVTSSDVTLPVDAEDGYRLSVANSDQTSGINVGGFTVPARGSVVVALEEGVWIEEAKTTAVLVDAVGDQRVRTRVFGGTPWEVYKVQVTVTTTEGRTMQNEFTIEIEED